MAGDCCAFKFLWRNVDRNDLMPLHSENVFSNSLFPCALFVCLFKVFIYWVSGKTDKQFLYRVFQVISGTKKQIFISKQLNIFVEVKRTHLSRKPRLFGWCYFYLFLFVLAVRTFFFCSYSCKWTRENSQSEYRKTVVYSTVLYYIQPSHRAFRVSRIEIVLACIFRSMVWNSALSCYTMGYPTYHLYFLGMHTAWRLVCIYLENVGQEINHSDWVSLVSRYRLLKRRQKCNWRSLNIFFTDWEFCAASNSSSPSVSRPEALDGAITISGCTSLVGSKPGLSVSLSEKRERQRIY